jgi:ABC-type ATPase with predicted acetyltransferase domain
MKFTIDRRFNSSIERTPRVLEIAEGFGLGLSNKEFVVYDNLEIEVKQGDVIYITGQSGSGKSLLLKDLTKQMLNAGLGVADLNSLVFDDRPVIDLMAPEQPTTIALDYLAKAGISDAWIYIRKPSELSDGQRYRLKLAMLMSYGAKADVWIADEFGAVLDRPTAKCVAFNMQKVARAMGKTLMVATTHTDLKEELGPSLTITKRFRERVQIESAA